MLNKIYFIIFFIFLYFPNFLLAKTINIKDEVYDYNPLNETGNDACEGLKEKIKIKAISLVAGEYIDQKLLEICNSSADIEKCGERIITSWSLGKGKITEFTIIDGPHPAENSTILQNYKQCRMSAVINVKKIENKHPGFDFEIITNQDIFKAPIITDCSIQKDLCKNAPKLSTEIKTTEPMYVYMFSWMPYLNDKYNIKKVFPNHENIDNLTKKNQFIFPIFNVGFPPQQLLSTVTEFIYILGINEKNDFLNQYDEIDFNNKIIEIYESKKKIRERKTSILIMKK